MNPSSAPAEPLCRPRTASHFRVERAIASNGIYVDIRHFGWTRRLEAEFSFPSYYLDYYLLGPRNNNIWMTQRGGRRGRPGEILFLPPGANCSTVTPPGEHSLLCLTFENGRARHLFESEDLPSDLPPCFDVRAERVRNGLGRLAEELRSPGFAQEILVESVALTLVVDLCRYLRAKDEAAQLRGGGLAGWRLRRLKERIDADFAEPLSIVDLAAECGMSARHLIRTFKTTTGMTLSDYIADVRITRAKSELREQGRMIKVVAGRCGFQSAAAFSAAFRRATGLTPKQYRQEGLRLSS